jgi:NADH:ubiquinone reductase (H+-translocating)
MTNILVLGGGFAGAYAANTLDDLFKHDDDVAITLISRNNYMVFTPLLAEVSGNVIEPHHAVPPLRSFLKKARFQMAEVREIDTKAQHVVVEHLDGGTVNLPYDYLVIALGSDTNYRRVPGAQENSFDLKTLEDAMRLRTHTLALLEQADVSTDPEERHSLLSFVGAGGGYAGVEGLSQLQDFTKRALRFYPTLRREDFTFTLATRGEELLGEGDERLGRYAANVLRRRGVKVRTGVTVKEVKPDKVLLEPGGWVSAYTVLWAAGIEVNPLVRSLDLPKTKQGALIVDGHLQVKDHPNIFALGDCAAVPKEDTTYAPTAQNASREGIVVARNIHARIRGGVEETFDFHPIGTLASLGSHQAVAQVWGFPVTGFVAWLMWRAVYLAKLPERGRKVRVFIDWVLELLLHTDIVQIRVEGGPPIERARPDDAPVAPGGPTESEEGKPERPDEETVEASAAASQ